MNIQVTVNSINIEITTCGRRCDNPHPPPPPPSNWHYYADLATGRER